MGSFKVPVNVKRAELRAVVIRKNGDREDLGVIAKYERPSWFRRLLSQLSFWSAMIALLPLGMASVVTNAGRDIVTNRIKGSGTEPNFVAMGTGAGTAAVTDTTLFTEVETRTTGTSTRQTTSVTNDTYQVVGVVTATATRAVTNAGLFDASSAGNLFAKADFSTINLASGDSIEFTFKVQFA